MGAPTKASTLSCASWAMTQGTTSRYISVGCYTNDCIIRGVAAYFCLLIGLFLVSRWAGFWKLAFSWSPGGLVSVNRPFLGLQVGWFLQTGLFPVSKWAGFCKPAFSWSPGGRVLAQASLQDSMAAMLALSVADGDKRRQLWTGHVHPAARLGRDCFVGEPCARRRHKGSVLLGAHILARQMCRYGGRRQAGFQRLLNH